VNRPPASLIKRLWPRSLFGRLTLSWLLALSVGHLLSFVIAYSAALQSEKSTESNDLSKDIAIAVAILERVPPSERVAWLDRLQRKTCKLSLASFAEQPTHASASEAWAALVGKELGSGYVLRSAEGKPDGSLLRFNTALKDGTPLGVEIIPTVLHASPWPAVFFCLQLASLIAFTWLAVRQATRPLLRLAEAAETLGSSLKSDPIPENGPTEIARAAAAFNAMQKRIQDHLAERIQLLAAISHDLQTPITRMRLRSDLMESAELRDKFQEDLDAMQILVEEGIAYARSAHSVAEPPRRIDLDALLDSLVGDYADAGQPIHLTGQVGFPITTRPHALRRIITNLTDNALKFGSQVDLQVVASPASVVISVLDRGPGIPEAEMEAVLQPFYRVEGSRNRATGGTGLGLAIAHQLTAALDGRLVLLNRNGGGLEARLSLPVTHSKHP